MKKLLVLMFMASVLLSCKEQVTGSKEAIQIARAEPDSLKAAVAAVISGRKADVGVTIIGPEGDTVSVNGDKYYALMSVAKFPQALALLHAVDEGRILRDAPLHFSAADLTQRTASTIRKDHPQPSFDLSIPEALRYSIGQSDNITSNKIFEVEGGPAAVTRYVHEAGVPGVRIVTDYRNMADSLRFNQATPMAMAVLLQKFFNGELLSDTSQNLLWKTMVEATSGPDRLKGMLPAGTVVGHKTGTSGTDASTGITAACNDIGIVQLPDGRHYSIAVFVTESKEDAKTNAAIIAQINKLAWDHFAKK